MILEHPDYWLLASRIIVSNHHKNQHTLDSFTDTIKLLYENKDIRGQTSPLIDKKTYKVAVNYRDKIQEHIDYLRDYNLSYFGFKTLERSYLIRQQTGSWRVMERPQHMWMRVAIGIHGDDLEKVFETYDNLSQGYSIHATPTLFLAGISRPQMSSCFLQPIGRDSMKSIYKCVADCAEISKWAGGIGIPISNIRAKGSLIRGTNGTSNGIVPMLKVFNDTARYVDQCFTPDTLLYTPNGPVAIGQLSEGDSVITHTGSIQKIERVLRHTVKSEVLRIKIQCSEDPIVLTGEHQVLVMREQPVLNSNSNSANSNYNSNSVSNSVYNDIIRDRINNGYAKLEWSDAKDVRVGDYVCFPKLDNVDKAVVDIPTLSVDDFRFYGILVNDGWIGDKHKGSGLLLNMDKKEVIEFCKNYLRQHGIHPTIKHRPGSDNIVLKWRTSPMISFTPDMFYDKNNEEIIDKRFFMLPKEKCLAIVQGIFGIFTTDVDILKKALPAPWTSLAVIEALRFLLWRCNGSNEFGSSVRDITDKSDCNLRMPNMSHMSRVIDINTQEYEGDLYDLEVENDHTYVTANLGIVHNGGGKRIGLIRHLSGALASRDFIFP